MSRRIDCDIIQDLLPLYVEHLASEASCRMIQEHLEECGNCRRILEELEKPVLEETVEEKQEIDFFKKIRNKHKRLILAVSGTAFLLAAILLTIGIKVFVTGSPVNPDSVAYECLYNEETRELTIRGTISYKMTEYSGLKVKKSGI